MSRRLARETALQVMFQVEVTRIDSTEAIDYTCEEFKVPEPSREFVRRLVNGTLANLAEIDRAIQSVAKDWMLERMAKVDRNILRLAGFELLFCPDIPGNVSVNEAIELTKVYSGEESGKFVNGILGALLVKTNAEQEKSTNQSLQTAGESAAQAEAPPDSETETVPEGKFE